MKRLYVGCRVRIVGSDDFEMMHHVGKEGRVLAKSEFYVNGWVVDVARTAYFGGPCEWDGVHLEPIQDPGRQVISWADMAGLWTPEGVEA